MASNVEEAEDVVEHEAYWTQDEPLDDDTIAVLASENDEDATLIMQFEDAVQHAVQSDPDLTVLFSSYQGARRRLTERVKFRGFWPVKKGFKGSGKKGAKSTGKGKLTLAQKIANSHCRLCGQKGHWKAECSQRKTASQGGSPTPAASVPVSLAVTDEVPMEILNIPELSHQATQHEHVVECFGVSDQEGCRINKTSNMGSRMLSGLRCCPAVKSCPRRLCVRKGTCLMCLTVTWMLSHLMQHMI